MWIPKTIEGTPPGDLPHGYGYQIRAVAGIELSIAIPLAPPEDEEKYRVAPGPASS
ncbi:hypothetical protein ACFWXO_19415 [Kitasatospora sp. NPDC059088]|uniref:hypothetical protein n=1 Tax=Kitasatospora sp. NPDC059088 TaxID=3346722 RepID=UPI00367A7E22